MSHSGDLREQEAKQVLTVSALARRARALLEERFRQVWVEGELSNLHKHRSGHWYFTLKDQQAQLSCAMFASANGRVRFPIRDGDQVRLRGRVSLYEPRGNFQLIVEHLEPAGEGALRAAFEALKEKLRAEGLFADERKKPLPNRPASIAVVSSATGAALQDFLHTLKRRFPALEVILLSVPVQGDQAGPAIVTALERTKALAVELVVVTRGGGSLEDLWAFNLESVARAIAACAVPVVSAVGHQTDVTIADFAADLRAATPTAAAELITPDRATLLAGLEGIAGSLARLTGTQLQRLSSALEMLSRQLQDPRATLQQQRRRTDELEARLQHELARLSGQRFTTLTHLRQRLERQLPRRPLAQLKQTVSNHRLRLATVERQQQRTRQQKLLASLRTLEAVSPAKTLDRGFAALLDRHGSVITAASEVKVGEALTAHLKQGALKLTVTGRDPDATLLAVPGEDTQC